MHWVGQHRRVHCDADPVARDVDRTGSDPGRDGDVAEPHPHREVGAEEADLFDTAWGRSWSSTIRICSGRTTTRTSPSAGRGSATLEDAERTDGDAVAERCREHRCAAHERRHLDVHRGGVQVGRGRDLGDAAVAA